MKLTLATILTGSLALFFSVTTLPNYNFPEYLFRLTIIFLILGILLSICILPWIKGRFGDKWTLALRSGMFTAFFVFDLGYLVFALSTLI